MVHTNGIESFWGVLKRVTTECSIISARSICNATPMSSQDGTTSDKFNTIDKITTMIQSSEGKQLPYQTLVEPKHTRQPALINNRK